MSTNPPPAPLPPLQSLSIHNPTRNRICSSSANSQHQSYSHQQHHIHDDPPTTHEDPTTATSKPAPLIPPLSFSMVVSNIYRSGYPLPINHPFLTLLRLRSIIYLSDSFPLAPTLAWAESQHPPITIYHFRTPPVKEPFVENDAEGMRQALEVILDKRNHPLLIHSNKGKHRAGVLTACVRKLLMGWSLAATFAEYGRYAGEKGEADLEFIELFSPKLTFDKRYAPEWLRVEYEDSCGAVGEQGSLNDEEDGNEGGSEEGGRGGEGEGKGKGVEIE